VAERAAAEPFPAAAPVSVLHAGSAKAQAAPAAYPRDGGHPASNAGAPLPG